MARVYRQGDVIFKEVDGIPRWAEKVGDRLVVEGETGNDHVLEGVTVYDGGREMYVELDRSAVVMHPQHKQLTLPAGKYMVYRVRDYYREGDYGD